MSTTALLNRKIEVPRFPFLRLNSGLQGESQIPSLDPVEIIHAIPHAFFQAHFPRTVSSIEMTVLESASDLVLRASQDPTKTAKTRLLIDGTIYTIRCNLSLSEKPTFEVLNLAGQGTFKVIKRIVDVIQQKVFARATIKGRKRLSHQQLERRILSIESEYNFMTYCRDHKVRHLPKVFAVRQHDHMTVGFDFEYCSVGTAEKFEQLQPVTKEQLIERVHVVKDVAETLSDLHDLGLCHNDLKPGNILLTMNKRGRIKAKVSDFGGMSEIGEQIAQCNLFFSDYDTRRAIEDKSAIASVENDLWSLGLMLYNFIHGEEENPICSLLQEVPSQAEWEEALGHLFDKLNRDNPIDALIYSILSPPRLQRPSASVITTQLRKIIALFKAR